MMYVTAEDFRYCVDCRRYFHRHPEMLFALDNTLAFVRGELDRMGIAHAEAGPASVTGYIGPENAPTVAIRADMDALPIQERTGLPFASEVPGVMHACGHDSHTALLLTVAQILKRREGDMPVRVKLLFQPSEEGAESGAKSMVQHGAMDGTDQIIAAHCDNELEVGTIGICSGGYMTASTLIHITFHGQKAHTATPEKGVDAIAMGVEAYRMLKEIVAEEAGDQLYIFGINCFNGGTAPNMVADRCEMTVAFRYYDMDLYTRFRKRCEAYCQQIAAGYGGTAELSWHTSAPPVWNDPALVSRFRESAETVLPGKTVTLAPSRLSEDFSWFLQEKPGFLFRFGTGNAETGCTGPLHCDTFQIDERGMESAAEAIVSYILNM